jgi:hypothetical protein
LPKPAFFLDRALDRISEVVRKSMLTVFSLKNPGRVDRVLSKKIYRGSVDLEEHLLARRATADCGDRRPKGYF